MKQELDWTVEAIAVTLSIAFPAYLSFLFEDRRAWFRIRSAATAFAVSEIMLLAVEIGVGMGWMPLDRSVFFAAVGIPCCIAGAFFGFTRGYAGVAISSCLSLSVWLFFISMH